MSDRDLEYRTHATPSAHRLPTLNGTQALLDATENSKPLPTSLPGLDRLLSSLDNANPGKGGIQRGSVTEIYGPPGAGKTTFAIQLAVNVITSLEGEDTHVTWVDVSTALSLERLTQILRGVELEKEKEKEKASSSKSTNVLDDPRQQLAKRFDYVRISDLESFLAVFLHPPSEFPPLRTSLIVVDDLSSLIISSLPSESDIGPAWSTSTTTNSDRENKAAKLMTARRSSIISSIASGLKRFAASRNVAVVVVNKASAIQSGGRKPSLRSALSTQQWYTNTSTRLGIYRDFWPDLELSSLDVKTAKRLLRRRAFPLRVLEVERLDDIEVSASGVRFVILKNGLREVIEEFQTSPAGLAERDIGPKSISDPANEVCAAGMAEIDEVTSHSLPETYPVTDSQHKSALKRKAIEISDSEDEHDLASETSSQTSDLLPPMPAVTKFEASSRTRRSLNKGLEDGLVKLQADHEQAAQPTRANGLEDKTPLDQPDDFVPVFTQAALDMSEPLTPSDDGGFSP